MKLNYFNFKEFGSKVLLTNDLGNHLFLSKNEFTQLLKKEIDLTSETGQALIRNHMVFTETNLEFSSRLKYDLRRIKGHFNIATSLHIFVVTSACNMKCVYCQANNGISCSSIHMTRETAERAVDISLQSPSKYLTFEFQGGEPLLNFEIIKHIVAYADTHKGDHIINYNIVTNLTLLTDEMIDFFVDHHFGISTSIDGPAILHDANRPFRNGNGTFTAVTDAIGLLRKKGLRVGAIQTTTRASLSHPKEIVRTYLDLGFDSIFLRPLTPLGKATMNWDAIGYTADEFIDFYIQALDAVIEINRTARFMKEDHASILLSRIAGHFVNYMELRSPCGAGIGQLAYYADGDIFTCDEGRMLHEMGDHTFRLGNIFSSTYTDIINNSVCKTVCASSILESTPSCCDCVYQPYCGTCPVVNYAKTQDVMEKTPHGYRCKIYSGMLDHLFGLLSENNNDVLNVLNAWSN